MTFYAILGLALVALLLATAVVYLLFYRNLYSYCAVAFLELFAALCLRQVGPQISGNISFDLLGMKADNLAVSVGATDPAIYIAIIFSFIGIFGSFAYYENSQRRP